ncbi:Hypothetical_protein [Hexamita inflata]|uniref:Hypothetical_protein n=1 Tax=Hexamita inflata TaxID=28002 RepID=A0AA86VK76_9EUKA|nr:Hypothetical protein HINF_LOCUS56688 [Hexamita inflata]
MNLGDLRISSGVRHANHQQPVIKSTKVYIGYEYKPLPQSIAQQSMASSYISQQLNKSQQNYAHAQVQPIIQHQYVPKVNPGNQSLNCGKADELQPPKGYVSSRLQRSPRSVEMKPQLRIHVNSPKKERNDLTNEPLREPQREEVHIPVLPVVSASHHIENSIRVGESINRTEQVCAEPEVQPESVNVSLPSQHSEQQQQESEPQQLIASQNLALSSGIPKVTDMIISQTVNQIYNEYKFDEIKLFKTQTEPEVNISQLNCKKLKIKKTEPKPLVNEQTQQIEPKEDIQTVKQISVQNTIELVDSYVQTEVILKSAEVQTDVFEPKTEKSVQIVEEISTIREVPKEEKLEIIEEKKEEENKDEIQEEEKKEEEQKDIEENKKEKKLTIDTEEVVQFEPSNNEYLLEQAQALPPAESPKLSQSVNKVWILKQSPRFQSLQHELNALDKNELDYQLVNVSSEKPAEGLKILLSQSGKEVL